MTKSFRFDHPNFNTLRRAGNPLKGTFGDEVLRRRERGAFRCRGTSVPYFAELAQSTFMQATIRVRTYGSEVGFIHAS